MLAYGTFMCMKISRVEGAFPFYLFIFCYYFSLSLSQPRYCMYPWLRKMLCSCSMPKFRPNHLTGPNSPTERLDIFCSFFTACMPLPAFQKFFPLCRQILAAKTFRGWVRQLRALLAWSHLQVHVSGSARTSAGTLENRADRTVAWSRLHSTDSIVVLGQLVLSSTKSSLSNMQKKCEVTLTVTKLFAFASWNYWKRELHRCHEQTTVRKSSLWEVGRGMARWCPGEGQTNSLWLHKGKTVCMRGSMAQQS